MSAKEQKTPTEEQEHQAKVRKLFAALSKVRWPVILEDEDLQPKKSRPPAE